MSVVNSGAAFAWLTPLLSHLLSPDSEIPITSAETPWVVSIIEVGNLLSPLPAAILSNYIGRKPVMLASGPIYIFSWLLILYFPTVMILMVCRVLQGLAMGLAFTAAPVYLGEIASDTTRGAITSIFFNSWWLGFVIQFSVGPYLDFKSFTWFTLLLNTPFLMMFFWQPESPYYYIMVGDEDRAYKSLKWFRDSSPSKLKEELESIKENAKKNKESASLRDIVGSKADRKALNVLIILTAVRICSGTGALMVYCTYLFNLTPNLSFSSATVTIALGVVMLIGGCVSSFTSDTLGRRPLLMVSCIGCLLCQFCTGTYYFLLFCTSEPVSDFSWVAPVMVLVYSALCSTGMYPVCASYTSELFSSNTRGIASSIGAINTTVFSFIMLVIFEPVTNFVGLFANFYIYAIIILLGSLYFYFSAPETKGKSFVQIRKELSNNED